jgi:hypothetical protein
MSASRVSFHTASGKSRGMGNFNLYLERERSRTGGRLSQLLTEFCKRLPAVEPDAE